jgi:putative transposase
MPRKARMYLPGVPCHIIQRGNNRDPTFFAEQDYLFYLECLNDAIRKYDAEIHAYVLMTNHVHMLMTPTTRESISLVMQSVGRRYVQYINREYRRTGTLWESRHKASLVDAENYLLACCRYIELNPVNAGMVKHPAEYRWSSYLCNGHGKSDRLIRPHEIYKRLGQCDQSRREAYVSLFANTLDSTDLQIIRSAARFSMPTGDGRFKRQIEQMLDRRIGHAYRGRPRVKRIGDE